MLYPLDNDAPPKNTETCDTVGINIISPETGQAGTECQVPLEAAWVLVSRVWQQIPDSPCGKKVIFQILTHGIILLHFLKPEAHRYYNVKTLFLHKLFIVAYLEELKKFVIATIFTFNINMPLPGVL